MNDTHAPRGPRMCRSCGCSDGDCHRCIERTGAPCWWVEPDLCSACCLDQLEAGRHLVKAIAADIVDHLAMPGAIVVILDRKGHLHVGASCVDHPVAEPLVVLTHGIHRAVEQTTGAVGDRPLAPRPRPPERAACIHCRRDVAQSACGDEVDDLEAIKQHSMTCTANPLVQELERLRELARPILSAGALCVECGPNVRIDEDGCCITCGGSAVGTWLFKVTAAARNGETSS